MPLTPGGGSARHAPAAHISRRHALSDSRTLLEPLRSVSLVPSASTNTTPPLCPTRCAVAGTVSPLSGAECQCSPHGPVQIRTEAFWCIPLPQLIAKATGEVGKRLQQLHAPLTCHRGVPVGLSLGGPYIQVTPICIRGFERKEHAGPRQDSVTDISSFHPRTRYRDGDSEAKQARATRCSWAGSWTRFADGSEAGASGVTEGIFSREGQASGQPPCGRCRAGMAPASDPWTMPSRHGDAEPAFGPCLRRASISTTCRRRVERTVSVGGFRPGALQQPLSTAS